MARPTAAQARFNDALFQLARADEVYTAALDKLANVNLDNDGTLMEAFHLMRDARKELVRVAQLAAAAYRESR